MQCFHKERQSLFTIEKKKPNCDLNLEKSEAENKSTLTFTWFHEIPCDNREHGINIYICRLFKVNIITKKKLPLN